MPGKRTRVPDRSEITEDTPLRLAVAAAIAFPGGGMTEKSLRRERDAGRLQTEMIAGKEFTTLREIGAMRVACRRPRAASSRFTPETELQQEERFAASRAALMATLERHKKESKTAASTRKKSRQSDG